MCMFMAFEKCFKPAKRFQTSILTDYDLWLLLYLQLTFICSNVKLSNSKKKKQKQRGNVNEWPQGDGNSNGI